MRERERRGTIVDQDEWMNYSSWREGRKGLRGEE